MCDVIIIACIIPSCQQEQFRPPESGCRVLVQPNLQEGPMRGKTGPLRRTTTISYTTAEEEWLIVDCNYILIPSQSYTGRNRKKGKTNRWYACAYDWLHPHSVRFTIDYSLFWTFPFWGSHSFVNYTDIMSSVSRVVRQTTVVGSAMTVSFRIP